MSTVYSSDTCHYFHTNATWSGARDASASNGVNATSTNSSFALYTTYTAGRGSALFYNRRVAHKFDLSGESGTVTAASFFWYCDLAQSTQGTDARIVHNTGFSTGGNSSDYNNLDFSEPHSNAVTLSTTLGYQEFALNSDALTRINSAVGSGDYDLMVVEEDHDFQDTTPTLNQYFRVIAYFEPYSGTSRDPKLVLTFSGASGYSHAVMGVSSGDIAKVKGVATADIEKVIGIN